MTTEEPIDWKGTALKTRDELRKAYTLLVRCSSIDDEVLKKEIDAFIAHLEGQI